MLERPEPDVAFLDLLVSPKQVLGLMIGGDSKANRVAAERIPLAAAYILKHYHHVDIKPSKLKMRDVVGIAPRCWDAHLPEADIDRLVNILWGKGYTLGQKIEAPQKAEPVASPYIRRSAASPVEQFLAVAGAVLGERDPFVRGLSDLFNPDDLPAPFIEGEAREVREVSEVSSPSPSFDIEKP